MFLVLEIRVDQTQVAQVRQGRATLSPESVRFLKQYPTDRAYVTLGTIHAPDVGWTAHYTTEDLIDAMRKEATRIGADALVDFRSEEKPADLMQGSYNPVTGQSNITAVHYKGLNAWAEAIMFVTAEEKKLIEP